MRARDLKAGDEIGPWTVVRVFEACGMIENRIAWPGDVAEMVERKADPWNTLIHVELVERGIPDPATWRTWYLVDEEVEATPAPETPPASSGS